MRVPFRGQLKMPLSSNKCMHICFHQIKKIVNSKKNTLHKNKRNKRKKNSEEQINFTYLMRQKIDMVCFHCDKVIFFNKQNISN